VIGLAPLLSAMEAEGLKSVFPMRDLSIMGLAEVIPHIPRVLRRLREARDAVLTANPDVLVTIDAQVFSAMLAKRVAAARPDIKRVQYVAPSVWAWKPWRAKSAAKIYDHMLTLFPFEPHYFEEHGLEATCVGHPLAERVEALDPEAPDALRAELGIAQDAPVLLIAPGSRRAEIARLANRFGDALAWLSPHIEGLEAILPVSPAVEARVEQIVADWPVKPHLLSVRGLSHEDAERRKFAAFAAADAALAASGTVTLELAALQTPTIIGYRMPRISEAVLRSLIRINTGSLVNVILGRNVIPEYFQIKCSGPRLGRALLPLMRNEAQAHAQREAMQDAFSSLSGFEKPSMRAAQIVLSEIKKQIHC